MSISFGSVNFNINSSDKPYKCSVREGKANTVFVNGIEVTNNCDKAKELTNLLDTNLSSCACNQIKAGLIKILNELTSRITPDNTNQEALSANELLKENKEAFEDCINYGNVKKGLPHCGKENVFETELSELKMNFFKNVEEMLKKFQSNPEKVNKELEDFRLSLEKDKEKAAQHSLERAEEIEKQGKDDFDSPFDNFDDPNSLQSSLCEKIENDYQTLSKCSKEELEEELKKFRASLKADKNDNV